MKLRIIAVPVGNDIKKNPNDTLAIFFFFFYYDDLQSAVNNNDGFERKILLVL